MKIKIGFFKEPVAVQSEGQKVTDASTRSSTPETFHATNPILS